MGSTMKRSIFDEQTSKALKQWHKNAMKKKGDGIAKAPSPTQTLGGTPIDSPFNTPTNINGGPLPPRRAAAASAHGIVMSDTEANASPSSDPRNQHSANIMASVDIEGTQQHPPPNNNNAFSYGNRDLLSGP